MFQNSVSITGVARMKSHYKVINLGLTKPFQIIINKMKPRLQYIATCPPGSQPKLTNTSRVFAHILLFKFEKTKD